jgi:hypothetical protein
MALHTVRPFVSRARGVIAFIAITWGVAAMFVTIEIVSLRMVDLALRNPAVSANRMLSRTVTESTSCAVAAGSGRPQLSTTISAAEARVVSWLLGLNLGRDAVFRQHDPSDRQVLDPWAAERVDLAARLAVRSPEAFKPAQIANANTEFVAFIEQGGAAETARQLAATHSPRACELFKLGAVWGYTEMARPLLLGRRAVFGLQIRHYAMRSNVPEPLWSPMLQVTAVDAKREDITASTKTMTDSVTKYLASAP